mmetsp:Transcript_22973/g.63455  ORF Transcript_22973/g.63455 Transcript_22973/m.63455 type:complete len:940 (-) Transcript_22973:763-3582(-)|eukprot:CAMPEP_0202340492 /NCGR_PEP_ID=MMETSP1126-20121109/1911_1 /ASSEMBLY_ACC=CAM_ASM_000457 /TAXON_ID=3047 /ORGANISM="Dunaliella tertiolecta, Strain CCMP1320" /LENGTH=939 /DNA_ID=CAMNT_0048931211 /DNA_START=143 /DNA_END=2962 /DNA_ORIENTATION=+
MSGEEDDTLDVPSPPPAPIPSKDEQLEDVSNCEAFKVLDALVESFGISTERADAAKSRYFKLHSKVLESMANEKKLLDQARHLKRKLDEDERTLQSGSEGKGAEATIDALREDVESAMAEAALAQERQQLLQLEVTDLQRQRNELGAQHDELMSEQRQAVAPLIENMRHEVLDAKSEVESERARVVLAQAELESARERLACTQAEIDELMRQKALERQALSKVEQLPEKAKRQSESTVNMMKVLQGQVDAALNRLSEIETAYKVASNHERELQEEYNRTLNTLDRHRVQVEAKERHADDIRKDVELASIEADKILADQVDLDLKIRNTLADARSEQDQLNRKMREKEVALRQLKQAQAALQEATDMLPNLRFQVEQLQKDKAVLNAHMNRELKQTEEVRRDLDIAMSDFLKEENVGKEKAAIFQLTFKQVALHEEELRALKHEEASRASVLADLSSQRDRVALSIAQKLAKVKEVALVARIKEVELAELKKIRKETNRRIRDFEKLYDLVKNQRNKFVNLIQSANQSTTEMKDKSKVLSSELDILHNEVNLKDRLLGQSRSQHASAVMDRDTLRIELGKLGALFRAKQSGVDEQIAEVDKLNAIINSAEKDMLRLRKQYELVIEGRNYTGIMLMDRNDELCILYEKSNIQEMVIKSGTLELRRREDEVRILNIEVAELERAVNATRKVVPHIPVLDGDVARLQQALLEARRESEVLSHALENPSNFGRWRLLEGKTPDKDELVAKIQHLEQRLNDRKEALLEKELILEEVTRLSDKLRAQASEGRSDTFELARHVSEHQSRLRAATRKIMATVSELSMYQATAMKLSAEREELIATVGASRERFEQGLAPTEDAEREWYRMLREEATLADLAEQRMAEAKALESKVFETSSTAEPRPNAYIPEEIGIPKPFGVFTPFKPSDPGSTMRHIRKPQPKEIVI